MSLLSRIASLFLPAVVVALAPPLVLQDDALLRMDTDIRVPVTLGVMSQCPDAMLCEAVFDQVLKRVMDIVDLNLTYVAR
jgi:hypothetical protein